MNINNNIEKITNANIKISYMLLILFIINLFCFLIFHGKTSILQDVSRELYIPYQMNNGEVLYKDIFNVYGPLGYQINAFFTSIFNSSLTTYYILGFINSNIILLGLYLILRFFIKDSSALILSILTLIISCCFYTISQTNYILPYSYSLLYSLSSFIISLVCTLYFLKTKNNKFLYAAFFLYGITVSSKYEFAPYIIVLIYILFNNKTNLKTNILCLLSAFIVPILATTDLLLKGVSFNEFKEALNYITLLTKSKSVSILYTFLGFIPSLNSLKELFLYFIKTFLFSAIFIFTALILNRDNQITKKLILTLITLITISLFLLNKTLIESNAFYFNWMGLFSLCLFIILIFKKRTSNLDKSFFILFFSTIICSYKCIFNISFNSYGTYYFPLLFCCSIIFIVLYVFPLIKINKTKLYLITITLLFLAGGLYFISNLQRGNIIFEKLSITGKGTIYAEKNQIKPIEKAVEYLKMNTNKDDTILLMPEGAVINFLADRKSNNKFYYLIPPNIEIFAEENIINELENKLPEYLIIQPQSYINFKETYFCESFGVKICSLIPKYYEPPIVFGDDFWIAIYKLKRDIIKED